MLSNFPYKAVAFDMDGVIADTAHLHFIAWKKLANFLNIEIDEDFNETLKGIDRSTSLERILAFGHLEMRVQEKQRLCEYKNSHFVELLGEMGKEDILPGVINVLNSLEEMGVPCVLASSSQNSPKVLEALGLTDKFHNIVDPSSLKAGKPAPDIFLEAALSVNVKPDDCLGIEDAVSGLQAIRAANMNGIGVGGEDLDAYADVVIPNLNLFADAIQRLTERKNFG